MKNMNAVIIVVSYKEVIITINGTIPRIAIVEIFSLQFAQKLAAQREELQPSVIFIAHYESVILVNNES